MRRRRGIALRAGAACARLPAARAPAQTASFQPLRHPQARAAAAASPCRSTVRGARPGRCSSTSSACARAAREPRGAVRARRRARPGGHAVCRRATAFELRPGARRPRGRGLRPARHRRSGVLRCPRSPCSASRLVGMARRRRRLRGDARAAARLLHDPRLGRRHRGGAAGGRRRQDDPLRRLLRDQAGARLRGCAIPQHVERLVLDSVVEPTGRTRSCGTASARFRACCASSARPPLRGLHPGPRRGPRGARGARCGQRASCAGPLVARRRRAAAAPGSAASGCSDLLFAGDFDPTLRAALPGCRALRAERRSAPLLRLALRGRPRRQPTRSRYFSDARVRGDHLRGGPASVGTHDSPGRARSPRRRPRAGRDPGRRSFARSTAPPLFTSSPVVQLCRLWPSAPAEPAIPDGPFPAVPTLVLSGEDDLRTPLESARPVAARIPGATLLGRARRRALRARLAHARLRAARGPTTSSPAGRSRPAVRGKPRFVPLEPIAPTALSQLDPVRQASAAAPGARSPPSGDARRRAASSSTPRCLSARRVQAPASAACAAGDARVEGVRRCGSTACVYVPGVRRQRQSCAETGSRTASCASPAASGARPAAAPPRRAVGPARRAGGSGCACRPRCSAARQLPRRRTTARRRAADRRSTGRAASLPLAR